MTQFKVLLRPGLELGTSQPQRSALPLSYACWYDKTIIVDDVNAHNDLWSLGANDDYDDDDSRRSLVVGRCAVAGRSRVRGRVIAGR